MKLAALSPESVKDDLPNLRYLANINGILYFDADAGLHKYDASADKVLLIKDGLSGITHWGLTDASVGGTVAIYFATHSDATGKGELWKSDGVEESAGGTTASLWSGNRITGIAHAGAGTVYFSSDNAAGSPDDPSTKISELFKTDGTTTTTIKSGIPGQVRGMTAIGGAGTVFFTMYVYDAGEDENVYELWKTDGTDAGTVKIKDGFNEDISYWFLTDVGGMCYFPVGFEGDDNEEESTFELWKSDGTAGGTVMVKDGLRIIVDPIDVNGTLYFSTYTKKDVDDDWCEIWKSDGTARGTILVKGKLDTVHSGDLAAVGSVLYFAEFHEDAKTPYSTIWRTGGSGSEAGTYVFSDGLEEVHDLVNVDDVLYYSAYSMAEEEEPVVPTLMPASVAPADSEYTADLMQLKQGDATIVKLAVGSVIQVSPADLSPSLAGEKFAKKPKVFGQMVDRTKSPAKMKKGTMGSVEKVSASSLKATLYEEWKKKMRIYDKKDYKKKDVNKLLIPMSTLLAATPVSSSMINGIFIQDKEFADRLPNTDPVELAPIYLLACPEVTAVTGAYGKEGDVFTVKGTFFGSKAPKVLLEYRDAKGNAKYKKCKWDKKNFPLRFSNAKDRAASSCMKVYDPDHNAPGTEPVGYSEITVLYPKFNGTATGYIIIDNGVGLCSYQLLVP
jgi:ELWxxDGT repeat protein